MVSVISDLEDPLDKGESLIMKMAHISAHNLDEKGFLLGLEVILTLSDRKPEKTARFRYNFHFVIDNLERMVSLNQENEPTFGRQFAATLAGISYSTLRGIIFERLAQSSWGSVTLPVIDPNTILESWIG